MSENLTELIERATADGRLRDLAQLQEVALAASELAGEVEDLRAERAVVLSAIESATAAINLGLELEEDVVAL